MLRQSPTNTAYASLGNSNLQQTALQLQVLGRHECSAVCWLLMRMCSVYAATATVSNTMLLLSLLLNKLLLLPREDAGGSDASSGGSST